MTGSYEPVKRFVRALLQSDPERVWRIEVAPGEGAALFVVQLRQEKV
jgi:hypothetical protein